MRPSNNLILSELRFSYLQSSNSISPSPQRCRHRWRSRLPPRCEFLRCLRSTAPPGGAALTLAPSPRPRRELVQQGSEAGVVSNELEVGVAGRKILGLLFRFQGGSEKRKGGYRRSRNPPRSRRIGDRGGGCRTSVAKPKKLHQNGGSKTPPPPTPEAGLTQIRTP